MFIINQNNKKMKQEIQVNQFGKTVNVFVGGKLRKKVCDTIETAKDFFEVIMTAKKDPTENAVKRIYAFLNEKTRIAMQCGLETDPDTQEVYLAGFNTPVPMTLVEVIRDYYNNGYPMESIINFWKLLMLNPDTRVRESLFDFIKTHDFVLTDNGYMVVYKAVDYRAKSAQNDQAEYISNSFLHVKKDWGCSPKKYVVYKNQTDGSLDITKSKTFAKWDTDKKNVEYVGNLKELYDNLDKVITDSDAPYTDWYSKTFKIKVGEAVKMIRTECDDDPVNSCSHGLHVGATNYVSSFGHAGGAVLVCYVNPAHVVAVPDYDHSKMRVSEYFPFAVANYDGNTIDIVEQSYFESDYTQYEMEELEEMVENVLAKEIPIPTEGRCVVEELETRSLAELQKIIENRLVDIS